MSNCTDRTPSARQSGVVLAFTLVMLLTVTVAGVSAMSAATLQLQLARNARHNHDAFQRAESALLSGEIEWRRMVAGCLNDGRKCTGDMSPPVVEHIDWDSDPAAFVTPFGRYVVEYLGDRPVSGNDGALFRLYRLTAIGESRDAAARTVLQSIIRICVGSDGTTCIDEGGD